MKVAFYGLRVKGLSFVTIILMCTTVFIWMWMRIPILSTFPAQGRFEQAQDSQWSVSVVGWGEDEVGVGKLKGVRNTEANDFGENRIEERGNEVIGEEEADSVESGKRERKKEEGIIEEQNNEGTLKVERSDEEDRKEGGGNEEARRNETENEETGKGKNGPMGSEERTSKRNNVKECNYAKGKWVVDNNQTLYSGFGCKQWLSEMWSCRSTRRTDFAYENLRWQPKDCQLERFEESKFLKRMQGKTLAFVGDSLGRQQFQSLICMITGGNDKYEMIDVGEEFGISQPHGHSRPNGWAFRFPSTNATVLYYWSASLCDIQPINASNPDTDFAMHLDRPAAFLTQNIHRINVLVLNTAHHWNRGKLRANRWVMHVRGGVNTDRHLREIWKARNLTVHSVVKWAHSELPNYPGLKVFYRTISPRHFSGGEWNTGGSCDNTTPMSIGKEIERDEFGDEVAASAVRGTRVKLLDITALSSLRDEAHISRFRGPPDSASSDCLHWCMPGVPDTWNQILSAQL